MQFAPLTMATITGMLQAILLLIVLLVAILAVAYCFDVRGWTKFLRRQDPFGVSNFLPMVPRSAFVNACIGFQSTALALWLSPHWLKPFDLSNWPPLLLESLQWRAHIGVIALGLAVMCFFIVKRRTPTVRQGEFVVEFHRVCRETVHVHIKRYVWWLYPMAPVWDHAVDMTVLPVSLHRRRLSPPITVALSNQAFEAMRSSGVTTLELYSPLLDADSVACAQSHWGGRIHGQPVTLMKGKLGASESLVLLLVRPLASVPMLQKSSVLLKTWSRLNKGIPLRNWFRPECDGFRIALANQYRW